MAKSIFNAMKKFLSTDTSRTSLCGYYVELDHENQEVTLTATNGHILCSHKKDLENFKFELLQEYNFLPNGFDTLESFIIYPNPKTRVGSELYELQLNYPRYQNIIPKVETMTRIDKIDFFVATNPKMAQICCETKKYFLMSGENYPFDYATSPLSACISQDTYTTVLIMPLRINY